MLAPHPQDVPLPCPLRSPHSTRSGGAIFRPRSARSCSRSIPAPARYSSQVARIVSGFLKQRIDIRRTLPAPVRPPPLPPPQAGEGGVGAALEPEEFAEYLCA